MVVTTDGQTFRQELLANIELLAKTEGDPLRKFCCRQCGECAPPELLEEGRFPDRIAWLRSHYRAKHPGVWGKVQAATIPTQPSGPSPKITFNEWLEQNPHRAEFIELVDIMKRKYGNERMTSERWYNYWYEEREIFAGRKPKSSIERLPQATIKGGELVPPEYRHLASWVSEPLPREAK